MTSVDAALLGPVRGVFMFVPVSSTSQLVIVQHRIIEAGSALPPSDRRRPTVAPGCVVVASMQT